LFFTAASVVYVFAAVCRVNVSFVAASRLVQMRQFWVSAFAPVPATALACFGSSWIVAAFPCVQVKIRNAFCSP